MSDSNDFTTSESNGQTPTIPQRYRDLVDRFSTEAARKIGHELLDEYVLVLGQIARYHTNTDESPISETREFIERTSRLIISLAYATDEHEKHSSSLLMQYTDYLNREAIYWYLGGNRRYAQEAPPKTRKEVYQEYMGSLQWRGIRRDALERADYKCQVCSNTEQLQVHHRTYDRFMNESPDDLIVLCKNCHDLFHEHGKLRR